jgi:hypothetical protein
MSQPCCRALGGGGLETLHEGDEHLEHLPSFPDAADSDLPDIQPNSFQFGSFQMQETNTFSQTQLPDTQGVNEASLAVLRALKTLHDARNVGRGSAAGEHLHEEDAEAVSLDACITGLKREEACKVFYQLLGACLMAALPSLCTLPGSAAAMIMKHAARWWLPVHRGLRSYPPLSASSCRPACKGFGRCIPAPLSALVLGAEE